MSLKSDLVVFRVVEYFLPNWTVAEIILRLAAAILFTTSILMLVNKTGALAKILVFSLLIPIADNIALLAGLDRFQSLFLFSNTTMEAIIQSLLLCLVITATVVSNRSRASRPLVMIIAVVCGMGLSFIKPVYIDDWVTPREKGPVDAKILASFLSSHNVQIDTSQPYLAAFFTTKCPYCALAAMKIGIASRNNDLPQVIVIFPSNQADAEDFLRKNGLSDIPYILVEGDTFLEHAGKSWPSIYYTKDLTVNHYRGGSFGHRVMEYIKPEN